MSERPTRAPAWLVPTLVVGLIASLILLGFTWHQLRDERADLSARSNAVAAGKAAEKAARKAVVAMTSYDYRTADKDFAWVRVAGTKKFQDQFAEASAPVRKVVVQLKAHAEGDVVDSAADIVDARHVNVLLFVDQSISNANTKGVANLEQLRVKMHMVFVGRWLVDEVELLNRSTGG